jgi:uncharacterized membrane protein
MNKLLRILRHRWLDSRDSRRLVPDDMALRLSRRIAASEARHSGEIRLCVEAALPLSYLWRLGDETSVRALARERAVSWFGRLGVWDTQDNNGVLIYLLLADHDFEIVADRGLHRLVGADGWEPIARRMEAAFRAGDFQRGIVEGIEAVGEVLARHYPRREGDRNELPDRPIVL